MAINTQNKKSTTLPKASEGVKNNFINIASHQLRTPLAGVRWSLDALLSGQMGRIPEKQKRLILDAYQSNKLMTKIVNDLIKVSAIEENGIKPSLQPTNLTALLKKILKKAEGFAQAYNCKISLKVEGKLPLALIDSWQIQPVIEGLLDNAITYTKNRGQLKISVEKAGEFILLKIADNGMGIPAGEQKLIFSKFFRGKNAMKVKAEGLGLDLYIAKKIIEASGGKIEFFSQENKGTVFSLYFPLKTTGNSKVTTTDKNLKIEKNDDILKKEREFVSITVHELKAPLSLTKWSLESLKGGQLGKLSPEQLELVEQINRGNERLLVLVRDLLDLSKLQEGKFDVKPQPIDLMMIIKDVTNGFTVEAKKKNLKIQLPSVSGVLPKVIADPNRLAQVITNLVSNAIKYTPASGQVTVNLEKLTGEQIKKQWDDLPNVNIGHTGNNKGYWVISVKDTGIGIAPEEQQKMFTRFFRSKKVLTSKIEGTGLGLYITKTIVDFHGGDIWFTSLVGQGSTFYFSLPLI